MRNESLAALDRGADEPPRLWLCHMLPDACLANPISPPHIACNWTGKTAEPSGHSCSLVRKGSWNKLALALRRAGTTGLPPRGRGGVACSRLDPPLLCPLPPPPQGEQSSCVPSLAVLRRPRPVTIPTPPRPQASLPSHTQPGRLIPSTQTSGWSAGH